MSVKHASAKQVRLAIYEREHQYVLQLQDDGQGFERRDIPSASHGLSTMRERAQKLGGEVEIDSKLGSGTRVTSTHSAVYWTVELANKG